MATKKKLSTIIPATTLKEWGLDREDIKNLTIEDLNDIGLALAEVSSKKGAKGAGGMCCTGMCCTGMCCTGK